MRNSMLTLFLAITAVLYGGMDGVRAQPREASEYAVKAAFLYHFAKFVEWPASSFPDNDTDVAICVLGEDPFGSSLEAMRGKTVGARKVAVKQIEGIEAIKSCHILFVSESEAKTLEPILGAAQAARVLTVSDMRLFFRSGGMIALFSEKDKVRFSINAAAAERAGLKISSHLLKLAVMIIE